MGLSVFISYATADAGFYRIFQVADNLSSYEDIEIVYYWQEHAVENIFDYMRDNIPKSDVFLIFFSENAKKSDPVRRELNAALQSQRIIIPVFVKEKFIDLLLSGERGVKFNESDFDGFIKELYGLIWKKAMQNRDTSESSDELKIPKPPPIQSKIIMDELANIINETEKRFTYPDNNELSEETLKHFQANVFDIVSKYSLQKTIIEEEGETPYLIVSKEKYESLHPVKKKVPATSTPVSLRGAIMGELKQGLGNKSIMLIRLTKEEIEEIENKKNEVLERVIHDLEKKKQKKLNFNQLIQEAKRSLRNNNFAKASEAILDAYLLAKYHRLNYNSIEELAFIFGSNEHYSIILDKINLFVENEQFDKAIFEGELLRNFCSGRGWEEREQFVENLIRETSQKRDDKLQNLRPKKLEEYKLLLDDIRINIKKGKWANARHGLLKARKIVVKYDINLDPLNSLAKNLITKMKFLSKSHQEQSLLEGTRDIGNMSSSLEFSSKYLIDKSKIIIIDNGTNSLRIGFVGKDKPDLIFPTIIGRPINSWISDETKDIGIECYFGNDALILKNELKLTYPIDFGWIEKWEDMERIWRFIFNVILKIDSSYCPVAVIESSLASHFKREHLAKIMFESFNVPALYLLNHAKLTCLSAGTMTGVIVDLGEGGTRIVPVINGEVSGHTISRTEVGGKRLTYYLQRLLKQKGHYFQTSAEIYALRDLKKQCGYIALDPEKELKLYKDALKKEEIYEISENEKVSLGVERFLVPEAYFNPSVLGLEAYPLDDEIFNSIEACDQEFREELFSKIILTGGMANTPGLKERLLKELTEQIHSNGKNDNLMLKELRKLKELMRSNGKKDNLRNNEKKLRYNPQIFIHPTPNYSAWSGGSIFACMNSFKKLWITKEEYQEYGPQIVSRCA